MLDKKEKLTIKIEGNSEDSVNKKLLPSNFDISEIKELLAQVDNLLRPISTEKSLITYGIKKGSVLNEIKAPKELIEQLNKTFYLINENRSLKGINQKQAEAIEYFQNMSSEKDRQIKITNTLNPNIELNITPYTNYKIQEDMFIETQLTLYGVITYMGGKVRPSIHLDSQEYGLVTIYTKEYVLKQIKVNMLYKEIGILVSAKQSIYNYRLDNVDFINFVEYSPEYDKQYIEDLTKKGKGSWDDVGDLDEWLKEFRYG